MESTTAYTWPQVLAALLAREDLTVDQAAWAMREILAGDATPSQIAGFAVALRSKGETIDEVEGLVTTMYEFATPLVVAGRIVDIVGTGGDRARTVNISTMAAIVASAPGLSNTATGPRRRHVAQPTYWRNSACRSTFRPSGSARSPRRSGSRSVSHRCSIPRCGTPRFRVAN
jgi:glycosyl transferase family protein with helical bundle domain/glycosyl transferase family 3 with a/b domain